MDSRPVIEQFIELAAAGQPDQAYELLHPEYEESFPQTGELIRGRDTWLAMTRNYPGMPTFEAMGTTGPEPIRTQVVRPYLPIGLPTIHISGGGNAFTLEFLAEYPNGDRFYLVFIGELKEGLIYKTTLYWAAPEEAPDWRAEYVDRIEH